jgi:hypothetical protein
MQLRLVGGLHLGDLIVVEGPLGTTNKGETTIWGTALTVASRSVDASVRIWDIKTRRSIAEKMLSAPMPVTRHYSTPTKQVYRRILAGPA